LRLAQFRKGNLAPNPSFESGPARKNGGPPDPRRLAPFGWRHVGKNVHWIDAGEAPGAPEEVFSGRRAVKVARDRVHETDAAEGVLSDFIPVLPGNYDFTYAVRLKDVTGSRPRLGTRLDDAVTVTVSFYDSGKKPVDPKVMNPVYNRLIDSSSKSYTFSTFWRIDDFPWSRVGARSYNYPFSEGDLPEGTRYVRLFLGLKGNGAAWFDDVDFRYSKWNFSALERFRPFFDRPLPPEETLVPAPRRVRMKAAVALAGPEGAGAGRAVVVLPENPEPAESSAGRLLKERLDAVLEATAGGNTWIVNGRFNPNEAPGTRLAFSVGNTALLRESALDPPLPEPPAHPEGYVIESRRIGAVTAVFLVGASAAGSFNAAATAVQLLDDGRGVYRDAAVYDYPDFAGRSCVFPSWKDAGELKGHLDRLKRLAACKLNKVYVGFQGRTPLWHAPDAAFREGVAEIGRALQEEGVMRMAMMVNPYAHFEFMSPAKDLSAESRYTFTHGDPQSLEKLKDVFRIGLDAGASALLYLSDDYVPHAGKNRLNFSLYAPEDAARFVNLQNAQAHIINALGRWLDADYPGTRLEFCPPWYNNEFIDRSEGAAEIYLRELAAQIPETTAIVWTGPTVRSLSIDMADLERYSGLIGRRPMIWDNTLYARNLETRVYGGFTAHYPDKVRMCNLFEPFDGARPAGFHGLNHGGHMYTNGAAGSEIFAIKYATVADYEWNGAAYDPERSLWKVLVRGYGRDCARWMLLFNDAYYGLYEACMRLEAGAKKGQAAAWAAAGRLSLKDMRRTLGALSGALGAGHPLIGELAAYRDRQQKRFEGLLAGGGRRP
jgi:hypothetical protein